MKGSPLGRGAAPAGPRCVRHCARAHTATGQSAGGELIPTPSLLQTLSRQEICVLVLVIYTLSFYLHISSLKSSSVQTAKAAIAAKSSLFWSVFDDLVHFR